MNNPSSVCIRSLSVLLTAAGLALALALNSHGADAKVSKGDDGNKPDQPKKRGDDNKGKDGKPDQPKKKDDEKKGKDAKPDQPKKKGDDNKGKDGKPDQPKKKDDESKGKDAKPDQAKKKGGKGSGKDAVPSASPVPAKFTAQATPANAPERRSMQGRAIDLVTPPTVHRLTSEPTKDTQTGKKNAPEPTSTGNLTLLREGYNTLALGNHVYDGHRHAAMNHLDHAARLLGADFSGDGRGHEPRPLSDAQLASVKALLEKGRGSFAGPALEQVDLAIKQLSTALSLPRRP